MSLRFLNWIVGVTLLLSSPAFGHEVSAPTPAALDPSPQMTAKTQSRASTPGDFQISGALDLYLPIPIQNGGLDGGRFRPRTFEIVLQGAIDPMYDAVINLAGDDVNGVFQLGLHEGYVSTTKLIPGMRLRAGRYFMSVGRLNQVHRHDWAFASASKSHSEFFSGDNVMDTGLEAQWLGSADSPFAITFGVTNGYRFGHFHDEGTTRPLAPTHYVRPTFKLGGVEESAEISMNYLARTDEAGQHTRLSGFDLVWTKRSGSKVLWLVQSETFHRYQRQGDPSIPLREDVGGWLYVSRAVDDRWQVGARVDGFTTLSLRMANGEKRGNFDSAISPILTYEPSELSRVRLAYTYALETRDADSNHPEQRFELQLVALLGTHLN